MENDIHYQMWPKDKPIPDGWILMNDLSGCHHGKYSVMIRKVDFEKLEG